MLTGNRYLPGSYTPRVVEAAIKLAFRIHPGEPCRQRGAHRTLQDP